jgi:predicted nucleic acid-binding protein
LALLRRVTFDSNALIYALEGTQPYAPLVWEALAMTARGMIRGVVPTVVALELLANPMRDCDGRAIDRIDLLLDTESNLLIRPLDRATSRRAATVRTQTGLSLADAVVVATALEERCDAVIGNDWRMASRAKAVRHLHLDDYVP